MLLALLVTMLTQFPAGIVGGWLSGHGRTHHAIWPQGWAFFAGSDRADFAVLYQRGTAGDLVTVTSQAATRRHLWGLSRAAGGEVFETEVIAATVPERYWRDCAAAEIADCRTALAGAPPFPLAAPLRVIDQCGSAVVAVERPSPPDVGSRRQIVRVAAIELPCER